MKLEIKNFKSFKGMEDRGFNLSLYVDGVSVGTVINEGRGGAYIFRIPDDVYARLVNYAKGQPKIPLGFGSDRMLTQTPETIVESLVSDYEHIQKLKKLTKTHLVFTLKGERPNLYSTIKAAYSPQEAARLRKEFPNLDRFFNEEFLKEEAEKAEAPKQTNVRRRPLPLTIAKRKG